MNGVLRNVVVGSATTIGVSWGMSITCWSWGLGPLVGLPTTAAGAVLGGLVGYFGTPRCVRCLEKTEKTVDAINKVVRKRVPEVAGHIADGTNKAKNDISQIGDKVVDAATYGRDVVAKADKICSNMTHITSVFHGFVILSAGAAVGFGLWILGANCNPTCTNGNAELVRHIAIVLSTTGVGLIALSALRAGFSSR